MPLMAKSYCVASWVASDRVTVCCRLPPSTVFSLDTDCTIGVNSGLVAKEPRLESPSPSTTLIWKSMSLSPSGLDMF
ncbi:hypothetical protein D3C79_629990 [compost metagenome]